MEKENLSAAFPQMMTKKPQKQKKKQKLNLERLQLRKKFLRNFQLLKMRFGTLAISNPVLMLFLGGTKGSSALQAHHC